MKNVWLDSMLRQCECDYIMLPKFPLKMDSLDQAT